MTKKKDLAQGDKVTWRSHGQSVTGQVKRKITERTEAAGRTVEASKDEPQYEVESDETGNTAVHKPSALRRRKSR